MMEHPIATFKTREEAKAAADRAMPRRKHNRPYAQPSGYHSKLAGHDVWIVCVPHSNAHLLADGRMFDHVRNVEIRP